VARLFDLWEPELPRLSGKSKLAEAIRYAISRRAALECFLSAMAALWRVEEDIRGKDPATRARQERSAANLQAYLHEVTLRVIRDEVFGLVKLGELRPQN
jgi:hypothetical protein